MPFRLIATLADNVTDYKTYRITFSDTMEKGLDFNEDSVEVTVNGKKTDDWKLTKSEEHAFNLMMEWKGTGKETIADKALNSAVVVVTFTATLNKDAVIGSTGNVNTGKLHYSNNPNVEDDGKPGTPDYPDTPENPSSTPEDAVIVFTYKADGKTSPFRFTGLDDGDYTLTETTVPVGYKAIAPIKFTVAATHKDTWDGKDATRKAVLTDLTGTAEDGAIEFEKDLAAGSLTGDVANTPSTPPTFEKKVQDINDTTGEKSGWQDSAD